MTVFGLKQVLLDGMARMSERSKKRQQYFTMIHIMDILKPKIFLALGAELRTGLVYCIDRTESGGLLHKVSWVLFFCPLTRLLLKLAH